MREIRRYDPDVKVGESIPIIHKGIGLGTSTLKLQRTIARHVRGAGNTRRSMFICGITVGSVTRTKS